MKNLGLYFLAWMRCQVSDAASSSQFRVTFASFSNTLIFYAEMGGNAGPGGLAGVGKPGSLGVKKRS